MVSRGICQMICRPLNIIEISLIFYLNLRKFGEVRPEVLDICQRVKSSLVEQSDCINNFEEVKVGKGQIVAS
jgi:hypothetical protein